MLRYLSGIISHIPLAAMAGVTAWMGICLLDWSAWRRLSKMTRMDALGFLLTAGAVVLVNAVLAVAIGCLVYGVPALYRRWLTEVWGQGRTDVASELMAEDLAPKIRVNAVAPGSIETDALFGVSLTRNS